MRKAAILLSTLALAACNMAAEAQEAVSGSGGEVSQRSYQLTGFDEVALTGSQDVVVTVGPAFAVRAEGDAEMLERLEIKVDGSTLKIGTKKGNWSTVNWGNRPKTRIFVSLPAIKGAAVTGSGDMRIDRVEGQAFAANVTGSGDLQVQQLQVAEAEFAVTGSGDIAVAAGTARRSRVSVTGSGDVDIGGVQARTASASVMGSGDARVHASESANVSVMGSGDVTVAGGGQCTINKRGSGRVNCVG